MKISSAEVDITGSKGAGPAIRYPASSAADLRIDGWLVQPSLNRLERGGTIVRVRAQLMDVLLCLASRPGKVFGKDELMAVVWGADGWRRRLSRAASPNCAPRSATTLSGRESSRRFASEATA